MQRESSADAARVMASLAPGAVVRGTVSGVRDFGAFVDLGGVEGLIPRSEIGHDRGVSVQDALKAGDVVEVLVREIKDDPKGREGQKRITLSLKALMDDPWQALTLAAGSVIEGVVARVVDFGAFIRIAPGIDGLLSNGDMGAAKAANALAPGAAIVVVVDRIDAAEHKIRLVPAPEGAVVGSRVAKQTLAVGSIVKGKVERIETYGVFLQVEGTTGRGGRGLVPLGELGVARGTDLRKTFPEGTELTAKVIDTSEGKLKLSVRGAKSDEENAQYQEARAKMSAPRSLGTLGDLLKSRK
jgi:small subunit ribosomal protein S1